MNELLLVANGAVYTLMCDIFWAEAYVSVGGGIASKKQRILSSACRYEFRYWLSGYLLSNRSAKPIRNQLKRVFQRIRSK